RFAHFSATRHSRVNRGVRFSSVRGRPRRPRSTDALHLPLIPRFRLCRHAVTVVASGQKLEIAHERKHGVDPDRDIGKRAPVRGPDTLLVPDEPEGVMLRELTGGDLKVPCEPAIDAEPPHDGGGWPDSKPFELAVVGGQVRTDMRADLPHLVLQHFLSG